MSPEHAIVFLIEDDDDYRKTIIETLNDFGHRVPITASTLDEALGIIEKLEQIEEQGQFKIDVAVIDGNLTPRDQSGRDGEIIAKAIKKRYPRGIITVGHALSSDIPGVDCNCPKVKGGEELARTITNV